MLALDITPHSNFKSLNFILLKTNNHIWMNNYALA